jgi:hypothetical protein
MLDPAQWPAGDGNISMDQVLTPADFAPHLGKVFRADGHPQALTFVTLIDRPPPGWPAGMRPPFSLILRSDPSPILPEGFYRFSIDDGPSFELHIMPVHTPSRAYQEYQIAFN